MLEFAHVVTGATLATKIGNPAFSFPLCLASNFLIDLLPHWNPHLYTEKKKFGCLKPKTVLFLFMDSSFGLILGLIIAFTAPDTKSFFIIILGSFLAVLGDLVEAPFYLFDWQNGLVKKLIAFQRNHQWNVPFWPGMISQIAYVLILLTIISL